MSNIYKTVIIAHFSELPVMTKEEIRPDIEIEFDFVSDKSINSDATITSAPTVEGDYIADHMYRQPKTFTLSGQFSLSGYQPFLTGRQDRLVQIETIIDDIQSSGVRCTILTRQKDNDNSQLFTAKDNMYLNNYNFNEKANSMSFTFSFTQVLTVSTNEIQYDENIVDDTIPGLTEPTQTSAFSSIIDLSQLDTLIDRVAIETGLASEEFMNTFWKVGVGVAAGTAGLITLGLALTAASGPIGWLAIGSLAVVGFAAYGLYKVISNTIESRKYRIEQFKLYDDDLKNKQEQERYEAFKSEIMNQFKQLENEIQVYDITSNQNQEMMILIDNDYYDIEFVRNNSTQLYSAKAVNVTSKKVYPLDPLTTIATVTDCNTSNKFFRTEISGYYVYLICPALANVEQSSYSEIQKNLTNYKIATFSFDPQDFVNILTEIIKNAVMR